MERHPIENLMSTTMENIRDMVDVNTVVGDAIATPDGSTVIPVSRVAFGFVAGGGEYKCARQAAEEPSFAGGTGAGVSVQPVGFIVISGGQVRLLPAQAYAPVDRIIEMVPQLLAQVSSALRERAGKAPQPALAARLRRSNAVERGDERRRKNAQSRS